MKTTVEVLEYIWLDLLSKGHLSGNDGIGQNVRELWCVSEAPRLKVVQRLPCSSNRNGVELK